MNLNKEQNTYTNIPSSAKDIPAKTPNLNIFKKKILLMTHKMFVKNVFPF